MLSEFYKYSTMCLHIEYSLCNRTCAQNHTQCETRKS